MDARRTLIADAALAVIGDRGIRGLSHHAVDAEAGIAKGSTSYYCRKRVDLLRLTLERLYVLDVADLQRLADTLGSAAQTHRQVAEASADLIIDWLTGHKRGRTIARFELYLAVSHEPELQQALHEQAAGVAGIAAGVAAEQPTGTPLQALGALMLAEGLMLSVVRQALPTPPREQVVALLMSLASDAS